MLPDFGNHPATADATLAPGGHLIRTVRLFACLLLSFLFFPELTSAQQVSLTILHTNDTHGHLLPFSYPSIFPPESELSQLKVRQNIGGIARRATLVKRLRAELESRGTTVWLVDAGDFCDGTPFSTEYHGEADVAAMNAAGYDLATLGNHEFNNPLPTLRKLLGLIQYPMVCANVFEASTGKSLTRPSLIRELGPLKIGVFGLTIRDSGRYRAGKEGLTVTDELETAQHMVKTLRPEAGIVIAISHAGDALDQQIAAAVPGLDIIIGGHTHSRLPAGQFIWHSNELKAKKTNGTVIVQAYQWGGELGRLDLLFTRDESGAWQVDHYHARLIPITSDIPEDPAVAAIVDRYWKPIAKNYGEIIGEAAGDFGEQGDDMAPYNLVADAVRETFATDIELENVAGVRAPLIKGKITRADLIEVDPFENKVVTFKITGRQLKETLRRTRPYVSGLRYRLENGEITELSIAGRPVNDDRVYTGATNTYFADYALKGIEVTNTGKLRRDVLIDYIRSKGTVKPSYDGRRVVIQQ